MARFARFREPLANCGQRPNCLPVSIKNRVPSPSTRRCDEDEVGLHINLSGLSERQRCERENSRATGHADVFIGTGTQRIKYQQVISHLTRESFC